jgi:cell fate (sporulation/competence/biofilm development) regulator YlbF (YheA/YmcA/DUF963 family)
MKRVHRDMKYRERDEKDDVIDTLRTTNLKLKRRLKTLNQIVERAIDRTDTKRMMNMGKKHVDPEHLNRIKEKEIENAEQQKAFYDAEIDRLEKRIDELSGVEKVLDLEEKVRDD